MNLFCIGLSHHTANVETRERFAGGVGARVYPSRGGLRRSAGARDV